MRRTPSGASAGSFTSNRFVVAMVPFSSSSGGEQPLVLALLPFERCEVDAGEPALDGGAERRLAPEPRSEGHVRELELESLPQVAQRAELVQLPKAVEPVAGSGALRHDERRGFEIPQHARRPAGLPRRLSDHERLHGDDLISYVSMFDEPRRRARRERPGAKAAPLAA